MPTPSCRRSSSPRGGRVRAALGRDRKAKLSLFAYGLSIPLAFAWRWVSVAILGGVALVWFIPDRRIQNLVESTDTGATG